MPSVATVLLGSRAPGQGARVEDGMLSAPDGPGLGVAPDDEWLGEPDVVYSNKNREPV